MIENNGKGNKKILLVLLPFWTPLIPPLGISCLKAFIRKHGYHVKTVDANTGNASKNFHERYFHRLKEHIPPHKRGNFYNIGGDVLRNHMMAHLYHDDDTRYIQLVKTLIDKTFFFHVDDNLILELNRLVEEFYIDLEAYFTGLLEKEKPAVLGISVYSGTLPASLFAFRLTKEKFPHIKTVMGGGVFADQLEIHSPNFRYFLEKAPFIDHIVVGEGETLFLKLLRNELPASQKVYSLKDIGMETLNLEEADIADFSDFDTRGYPKMAAYVSRSCLFQCSFCSETVQWGRYRKKSPRQIVNELITLYETHNSQLFLMGDSLLNPVADALSRELMKTDTAIYWDGYLRADAHVAVPETTMLWRRGGFYRARLGVESGSRRVLELMGKRLTPDRIRAAVRSLALAGIKTTTYWVIGHPGETEEDFRATLQLIEELRDDLYEAECNPFNLYVTGQVGSDKWKDKRSLLYPPDARDMLITQTWTPDIPPLREETYRRVNRFVQHCRECGVPNPYTFREIYDADERWKKLHKNAVPALVEFEDNNNYIDENKKVKEPTILEDKIDRVGDFAF